MHVALNTLVKESELPAFFASAEAAWNAGADALIIQDLFLGAELKRQCPQMVLHLSTQAGVCNAYGARLAKRYGFSRVILARETPLADIAAVCKEIETEVFVQGALCTCFSGQCYLSSFAGGNSGNRGLCKQPCRKRYTADRKGFGSPSYALSLSDLCVGERVKQLAQAGVASFKIEGRMRSAAYVGAAVRYYRDIFADAGKGALAADLSALKRAYNRGDYTQGYAFGEERGLHSAAIQGHMGERVGTVARFTKDAKRAYISSSFSPREGDGFKVIRAGAEEIGGGSWRAADGSDAGGVYLPAGAGWKAGDGVYLTADTALAEKTAERKKLGPLRLRIRIAAGELPEAAVSGRFGERTFRGGRRAEAAQNSPLCEEDVRRCFLKTDGYPFAVEFESVDVGAGCFLVRSALNAFRRSVFEGAAAALAGEPRVPVSLSVPPPRAVREPQDRAGIAVIGDLPFFSSPSAHMVAHAIFKPTDYKNTAEIEGFLKISEYYAWHTWLYLPPFMTEKELASLLSYLPRFCGVYGEGVWAAQFCREHGLRLFAGVGFNLFNSIALAGARAAGAEEAALSKELSSAELVQAGARGAYVLAGGGIKVMDLIHCPFGRSCGDCDRRRRYTLTDEAGRAFPLLRYETSVCRFELYNPSLLDAGGAEKRTGAAALFDLTALGGECAKAILDGRSGALPHTSGAFRRGVN